MSDPDSFNLDREAVRRSFDKASCDYEAAAVLQATVADELLSRLDAFEFRPQVVLDLGAGPGRGAAVLKRKYRNALVIALDLAPGMLEQARRHQRLFQRFQRVCADASRLPFAGASADVIFSSLMLQWCDLDATFAEIRRVLKPGGLFAFSTFGPDTLMELRASWAAVDEYHHVHPFKDMHDVGDALVRAGLVQPVLDVERVRLTYSSVMALMRDLKGIGAHNASPGRAKSLTGKSRLQKMAAAYEGFRENERLPATYEVVYGVAWGAAAPGGARAVDGEIRISPSDIGRRSRASPRRDGPARQRGRVGVSP
jgi:malonyl-CoA O-methyltransferase